MRNRKKENKFKEKSLKTAINKGKLAVTNHAVQRFQSRIADIAADRIRNILQSDTQLYDWFFKYGDGKYKILTSGKQWCVVRNGTILTVFNNDKPYTVSVEDKMRLLVDYLEYKVRHSLKKGLVKFEVFIKENWNPFV